MRRCPKKGAYLLTQGTGVTERRFLKCFELSRIEWTNNVQYTVGPRITLLTVPEKYVVMRNSAMRITT